MTVDGRASAIGNTLGWALEDVAVDIFSRIASQPIEKNIILWLFDCNVELYIHLHLKYMFIFFIVATFSNVRFGKA